MTPTKPAGAELLRKWREDQKLNQTDAASFLGMDAAQFARFERGEGRPNAVLCAKMFQRTNGAVPAHAWGLDENGQLLVARQPPQTKSKRRRAA